MQLEDGSILSSADGINWVMSIVGDPDGETIDGLDFQDGYFQAKIFTNYNTEWIVSKDGMIWKKTNARATIGTRLLTREDGVFLTLYLARNRVSMDEGDSWETINLPPAGNTAMTFIVGGKFFSASGHKCYWSEDGKEWDSVDIQDTGTVSTFVYRGGRFYATMDFRTSFSSTDGVVWTPMIKKMPEPNFHYICYFKSAYLTFDNNKTQLLRSQDGLNWSLLDDMQPRPTFA